MHAVQIATLFTADNTLHYIFFIDIELTTTAFMLYTAWKWKGLDHLTTKTNNIFFI